MVPPVSPRRPICRATPLPAPATPPDTPPPARREPCRRVSNALFDKLDANEDNLLDDRELGVHGRVDARTGRCVAYTAQDVQAMVNRMPREQRHALMRRVVRHKRRIELVKTVQQIAPAVAQLAAAGAIVVPRLPNWGMSRGLVFALACLANPIGTALTRFWLEREQDALRRVMQPYL